MPKEIEIKVGDLYFKKSEPHKYFIIMDITHRVVTMKTNNDNIVRHSLSTVRLHTVQFEYIKCTDHKAYKILLGSK